MAVAERLSLAAAPQTNRAKILLVDDRSENLLALQAILEPLGQELVKATSGTEALKQILLNDFAVILMDVKMPDMDGFETTRFIKDRDKSRHIPIIFITALDENSDAIFKGYSAGAVDYIHKPFNEEILRSKVSVFVELFLKEQQIREQAALIQENILREAERVRVQQERELEQKHLRELAVELEKRVEARTRELLEANNEMESFCYSVAHDLRAPVRNVIATSKMLLEDLETKLSVEESDQLRQQVAASMRMATLIDDLLRLYRLNRKELVREEVHLSEIAERTAAVTLQKYPSTTCTFEVEKNVQAKADRGLLRILLDNLFDNAFKYSPNGGAVRFGTQFSNGRTCYYVKDDGIGFDMTYHAKLFKPFERLVAENDYPGTGIGLAMVQKIVTRHGGRVWADGELGKGSTFYFTLGE